jgi:hypothetical protein
MADEGLQLSHVVSAWGSNTCMRPCPAMADEGDVGS